MNGKLASHQVAAVAGLDVVPAAAGLVGSSGSIGRDRSSSGRRHRRKILRLGGWQLGSGWFDAKRGAVHHVEVGTYRADDRIPSQHLWLCDVRNRSDCCAGRVDCHRDSFARVGDAETTRSWELVTISTEVVVRQHPRCTDTLSLRDAIAIITVLDLVHGAVAD